MPAAPSPRTVKPEDLIVPRLGEATIDSPFIDDAGKSSPYFVPDDVRIRWNIEVGGPDDGSEHLSFEEAGPREKIFFDPAKTTAAIVTCGGISPGLNNVIRSVFYELSQNYGVRRVLGLRDGYRGLVPGAGPPPIEITSDWVESIDKLGGTALGSSRGPQPTETMADFLISTGVNLLFCLGGDGTQRGAAALSQELRTRQVPVAVVGVPKTIDNDIAFVDQTFGYATALEKASAVIRAAHVEARGAPNAIGLVKLMGRHAGFIAAGASVISQEVDYVLIPEVPFPLDGEGGLLQELHKRLERRRHAVVVVAEGAGQHLFENADSQLDASGNRLNRDIGEYLKYQIREYFQDRLAVTIKYLDPSYFVRSVPANVYDRFLADQLGRHAVHAGMAGRTDLMIGHQHSKFIHVPIEVSVRHSKSLDVQGDLWRAVLSSTGQPNW